MSLKCGFYATIRHKYEETETLVKTSCLASNFNSSTTTYSPAAVLYNKWLFIANNFLKKMLSSR